jgi:hypothetical protein
MRATIPISYFTDPVRLSAAYVILVHRLSCELKPLGTENTLVLGKISALDIALEKHCKVGWQKIH